MDGGEKSSPPGINEAASTAFWARLIPEGSSRDSASEYATLCSTCTCIFDSLPERLAELSEDWYPIYDPGFPHHSGKPALEKAALLQCSLCQLFLDRFVESGDKHTNPGPFYIGFWIDTTHSQAIHDCLTHITYQTSSDQPKCWYDVSFIAETAGFTSRSRQLSRLPSLGVAYDWIQECKKLHDDCRRPGTAARPTRLLHLGQKGDVTVRLSVMGEDLSARTEDLPEPYVALSHCWGSRPPKSRLTTANLESFRREISFNSLGKTLRDAISTTRDLGYKYLWVDTLCIVQDDSADWQKECSRMEDVYRNSDVTIAAASAADGSAGFLSPRLSLIGRLCEILVTVDGKQSGHIAVQSMNDGPHHSDLSTQLPLHTRSWTFQEQLLPLRILYFGKYQMYFECISGKKSETSPHPFESPPWRTIPSSALPSWIVGLPSDHSTLRSSPCSYYDLLNQYMRRDLTYGDDILPALSAISRRHGRETKDEYLAGLWREDLLRGLCWRTYGTKKRPRQTLNVPSWSWASARWTTRWEYNILDAAEADVHRYADVVSASIVHVGLDPFGQVNGGEIVLRGRIQEAVILDEPATSYGYFKLTTVHDTSLGMDSRTLLFWPDDKLPQEYLSDSHVISSFFLLAATVDWLAGASYSLALAPADGRGSGCLRRIGLIEGLDPNALDWMKAGAERTVRIV